MQKTILLILKPEDSDLLGWKASLPHRTLNKTVNEILLAESKGKIADTLSEFSSIESSEPINCVIRIADENVARFVDSLPKGDKAESIKKIIRKHIRKNKELPPSEAGIPAELLATKIESLKDLLIEKANFCAGEHDKNRKLKAIYEKSLKKRGLGFLLLTTTQKQHYQLLIELTLFLMVKLKFKVEVLM